MWINVMNENSKNLTDQYTNRFYQKHYIDSINNGENSSENKNQREIFSFTFTFSSSCVRSKTRLSYFLQLNFDFNFMMGESGRKKNNSLTYNVHVHVIINQWQTRWQPNENVMDENFLGIKKILKHITKFVCMTTTLNKSERNKIRRFDISEY